MDNRFFIILPCTKIFQIFGMAKNAKRFCADSIGVQTALFCPNAKKRRRKKASHRHQHFHRRESDDVHEWAFLEKKLNQKHDMINEEQDASER